MKLYALAVAGLLSVLVIVAITRPADAQTSAGGQFEVASIKPVEMPTGPHGVSLQIDHGRVTFSAATLRQIIGLTYEIQRVRVLGGPDWLDTTFYDVVAKTENADAGRGEILVMLQRLLADRFQLAVHRETRDLTEFELVVGKHGAKLVEAADGERQAIVPGVTPAGARQMTFFRMPMAGLANLFANLLGSPVTDQTGLKGLYDFKLEWPAASSEPGQAADPGSSLIDGLSEQIGLNLQSKKRPAEVLVIDHARSASEN